jgi:hypothetical protein
MDEDQVRRQYIFAFAGPLMGWFAVCVALGKLELLLLGSLFGLPFIYLFGMPVTVLIYCLDRELINRSVPLALRSLACLLFGGLLSFALFHFVPLPVRIDGIGDRLATLPGAFAGFVCSWWGGRQKLQPRSGPSAPPEVLEPRR